MPLSDPLPPDLPTPSIPRRLAAFLYEGVLLFGLLMVAGLIYSGVTQMRHALHGQMGLRVFLFVVLAFYFVGFWAKGGQTVAMKAWHVRLVDRAGHPVTRQRAFARYLLAWLWFVPALAILWLGEMQGLQPSSTLFAVVPMAGVITYALLARLNADHQFFHDVVCGTRLVSWRPPKKS